MDELHEYNNDSGQGDAMAELFGTAKKVIGMTATLINGYSSGIFHLLYRTSAQLMLADGKPHEKPALFNTEYGVVETTYTEADESYAAKRRSQKSNVRTRQLPGVSPLVFSRFLLEKTAFLSLSDMGKALPSYEEIPIACRMDEAVQSEYKRIENALVRVLRSDRRAAQKILSAYLNLLTVYPDQPYDQKPILYPDSDVPIVEPENIGDADTLGEKELRTLEIVRAAIQNRERALIYTSWVRTDSQQKLKRFLTDEGYCTKKKKPRLLKRWHKMLRVPDWCKKRIRPSLVRIYDFASTESWLMHENLCKSLGREIGPTASRYTLSEVRQLDLDAYAFQKQVRTTPVEELLNVHLGLHQVVEVFDGVQSVILYKTLDGFVPAPTFDAERARQNRREQKKASA